jgi:L-rhamnose isomerase
MNGIEKRYDMARELYAEIGVDTESAIDALDRVPLSLHCWQGDDVVGFESPAATLAGSGLQVTGSYPGRARNIDELRADLDAAFALIPGKHRLNLHAIYGDFGGTVVERDAIGPEHFQSWVTWAHDRAIGLDFNATCFSHPMARSGFTLASLEPDVRQFWVDHVRRCREIAASMGRALATPCVQNLWIPDGSKDLTVNRWRHRELLIRSLDDIFTEQYPREHLRDAVESKLFGIGSEAFVVGSHEFYLLWAKTHGTMVCLDMGHFHPTESVADKVSALLPFFDEMLIHVSRGVRWDSDHVVIADEDLARLAQEIVWAGATDRVRLALDFFDASMNRVGAWAIGACAVRKSLLAALLSPIRALRAMEEAGDFFGRLALLEECRTLPAGAVWDFYCEKNGMPTGPRLIDRVREYERKVLSRRS